MIRLLLSDAGVEARRPPKSQCFKQAESPFKIRGDETAWERTAHLQTKVFMANAAPYLPTYKPNKAKSRVPEVRLIRIYSARK